MKTYRILIASLYRVVTSLRRPTPAPHAVHWVSQVLAPIYVTTYRSSPGYQGCRGSAWLPPHY